ncbi:MAG: hypothetical protein HY847_10340 [Betaproteobacteria bacterium]|nr:hypothetical protein [Betaproteobacteria bacterium]
MSVKTIEATQDGILGAKACLAVLRNLEKTVTPVPWSAEQEVWNAKRDDAIAAFLDAAGPLPPRATGAMSLLAEFVIAETQDGMNYFKDTWKPRVTVTKMPRGCRA